MIKSLVSNFAFWLSLPTALCGILTLIYGKKETPIRKILSKTAGIILLVIAAILIFAVLFSAIGNNNGEWGEWGEWSDWNTASAYPSESRQVETREQTMYNMVVYVTQEDTSPHYRNFRDYSINGNYSEYNARKSYGEKCLQLTVSSDELKSSAAYGSGALIRNGNEKIVGGYNCSGSTAYLVEIELDSQGRYYPLFIESSYEVTEYRYRDKR